MGKSLVIPDADFSANGIKTLSYMMSSEAIIQGSNVYIVMSALGCGYLDQNPIRGIQLKGVRLKVQAAGTLRIFKGSDNNILNINSSSQMTLLTTIQATETGVQDIMFSSPISIGDNECIIFGDTTSSSNDSLVWYYKNNAGGTGAVRVGGANAQTAPNFDIAIAFIV